MPFIALPILWILAVSATVPCAYVLTLTLLSAKLRPPARSTRTMRFDVIIPAHNEEAVIAQAVHSLLGVDWPRDKYRLLVVADNCSDATAEVAARSGAEVLVRQDDTHRGKGHALARAFDESRQLGWADAVVVVDADSRVSANLLEAFAARMERGESAVQVHYGVTNIHASWRTRLMAIAMAAFHLVRSRGRERLGVSCGIRGNGWGLTHSLLKRAPYASFSLTEDLEYGIAIGRSGIRVAYADEAHCNGEMVSRGSDARSQRVRWEQGRFALIRSSALALLKQAVLTRNAICFDLAMELLVLPLSYVVLNSLALTVAAVLLAPDGIASPWGWLGLSCCASLAVYVLRGWQLSGTGHRGLFDLMRTPFFLVWKMLVMHFGRRATEWVRTNREDV